MDKDRVKEAAQNIVGKIRETVGKVAGTGTSQPKGARRATAGAQAKKTQHATAGTQAKKTQHRAAGKTQGTSGRAKTVKK